ncbi:MAG: hypothetical protein RBT22_12240 [Aliarcobacter sp.]|jgi:transposase|nr:hypothetical protein [Aliarcobacter sp.]
MDSLSLAKKRAQKEQGLGRKSKLDDHLKAIEYLLYEANFSLKQVQSFLEEDCNCKVSYSNLQGFCKRRFLNKNTQKENITNENIVIENKINKEKKVHDIFANLKQ